MPLCAETTRSDDQLYVLVLEMKKILYIGLILLFAGCEVIGENERLIPVTGEGTTDRRHVLLEFTGFRCVNCPTAAKTAQALHTIYGENLIVIALHPASNPFTQGKEDYTCPEADSVYRYMGGTETTPFPTGNIDLKAENGTYFFDAAEWSRLAVQAMADSVAPDIAVTLQTDTVNRTVSIQAVYTSPKTEEVQIAFWLVEDSIPGMQAMPDGSVQKDYPHRHVLRAAANNQTWGQRTLMDSNIRLVTGDVNIPQQCRITHCSIVALMFDTKDKHILQAYETKLDDYDYRSDMGDER